MSPLRFHVDRIERLAGRHEQAVALRAAEADVGANLRKENQADPLALLVEDVNAVVAVADPAAARPDVAVHVRANAVREPGDFLALQSHLHRTEFLAFAQLLAV